jgi:drug/metabolite transporter (DMT)-like permease
MYVLGLLLLPNSEAYNRCRLLLFLIFFPRATPSTTNPAKDHEAPSFRIALAVVAISVLHAIVIFILSVYFVLRRPDSLQGWANFLGIFATVLSAIQYFPQIYTTYMLKRVGSLSIPMMCIQTPGSFLWATSLAARYGRAGWSTWGVYMVTGCLQGTLLGMSIYFELKARKLQKGEDDDTVARTANGDAVAGDSEETPLLRPAG